MKYKGRQYSDVSETWDAVCVHDDGGRCLHRREPAERFDETPECAAVEREQELFGEMADEHRDCARQSMRTSERDR
ncbi:hypothetical protein WS69_10570 [Burkholderia sp. BDU5]|nr:hypothetical protein WS69_10570 [Burkholderia sp. BDU5]